jgi:hypothetical protein
MYDSGYLTTEDTKEAQRSQRINFVARSAVLSLCLSISLHVSSNLLIIVNYFQISKFSHFQIAYSLPSPAVFCTFLNQGLKPQAEYGAFVFYRLHLDAAFVQLHNLLG